MNKRRLLLFTLFMISLDQPALAAISTQPSAPSLGDGQQRPVLLSGQTTDLTLGDAVYLGLRNNRGIRSAYLQRVVQKFDLRISEDTFNPKLLLSANYQTSKGSLDRGHQSSLTPATSLLSEYGTRLSLAWTQQLSNADQAGRFRSDGLNLSIIQPLLRGAGWEVTTAPVRQARLAEQSNRLMLKSNVAQTITLIISTYREILRSQEQLKIAQAALERAKLLLDVNRALIAAGRMAEFEIVQTEADIASQELGVEEAQNQTDISRLSLLRLLALDLSTPIHATEALEAAPITVNRLDALRLAQQQQPEYLAQLIGSQQADINLVVAKNESLWDVSLVAGANQVRDRFDSEYSSGSGRNWDSYAGVQVQIPIGDLSTRRAEVSARVDVENQQLLLADARQALERSVNDVVRDLGVRWRQYEISRRAVELTRRTLDIEREKLNAGLSSNFQVLSFEGNLRNAENARLSALIAYLNAQTRLDLTLGMTLESWDIALNDY